MPDEHGIAIAIENLVQGDGIDDQPLGVGAVGEAVEAQRQRAGPGLQQANVKLVRQHHADSSHPWRGARGSHDVPCSFVFGVTSTVWAGAAQPSPQ